MKSNNKIVVNRIREHIKSCLSEDQTQELGQQLQNVATGFNNWYGEHEKRQYPNRQQAFGEWLMCLPSELSVEYYHYKQEEALNVMLEGVSRTKANYSTQEIQDRYLHLIYREITKMFKEHGIKW